MLDRNFNSSKGFITLKAALILVGAAVFFFALSIPFYQNLKMKSIRAEAKVMLSYLATLENVYKVEKGSYAYFPAFYGAQMSGEENCSQPEGAKELGFILRKCKKDPRRDGLRYAYRVLRESVEDTESFRAEAVSGSDLDGQNFVCAGSKQDVWKIGPDKKHHNISHCE